MKPDSKNDARATGKSGLQEQLPPSAHEDESDISFPPGTGTFLGAVGLIVMFGMLGAAVVETGPSGAGGTIVFLIGAVVTFLICMTVFLGLWKIVKWCWK